MHIRLCMIVKNEARVIERCLDSVLPHIHSWCIVDTGSSDETRELIWKKLGHLHGILHQRPWVNHAHNRTEAFHLAADGCSGDTYIFWLDAKDVLVSWPETIPTQQLGFNTMVRYGNLEYDRPALLSPDPRWKWSQGVHEALTLGDIAPFLPALPELAVEPRGDGASAFDPEKFKQQVEVLRQEYETSKSTRAAYYLAQALRDSGQTHDARAMYLERASMAHGWLEETWSAQLEAAKLTETLQMGFHQVSGAYLIAHQMRETRAEALYHLARYCRCQGKFGLGLMFAQQALKIPRPRDQLFIEFPVYGWLIQEEIALCYAFSGRPELAREAIEKIDVKKVSVPSDQARIKQNRIALGCNDDANG